MKDKFGLDSELKVGQSGDFEVLLEGRPVFSKRAQGRFPNPGEVETLFGSLLKKA